MSERNPVPSRLESQVCNDTEGAINDALGRLYAVERLLDMAGNGYGELPLKEGDRMEFWWGLSSILADIHHDLKGYIARGVQEEYDCGVRHGAKARDEEMAAENAGGAR